MIEFLTWLENLSLSVWVRESGTLLAYPTILFLHTVGLAIAVGLSAAVSLRVLGVAPGVPIAPLEAFYRLFWGGFWLNAATGLLLLVADATTKFLNPVFYVKMGFVAIAMIASVRLRRVLFRDADRGRLKASARPLAVACLVLWVGAITAGRLMAYLGPVSGAPGLSNTLRR